MGRYASNRQFHEYNTRRGSDIRLNYLRLLKSMDGVNYYAIKFFNVLPSNVRQLPFAHFKSSVKNYLISKAFYTIDEFLVNDFIDM
ncbi:hypothetical protein QE152_g37412 [Popillia japonica]|uniref:Uncharacterized protein n=1 Tax=Popillia japonica TaxID=7064 RepID=A0AAW1IAN8_POPJA